MWGSLDSGRAACPEFIQFYSAKDSQVFPISSSGPCKMEGSLGVLFNGAVGKRAEISAERDWMGTKRYPGMRQESQ